MKTPSISIALGVACLGFTMGCGSVYKVSPIISQEKSSPVPWENTEWARVTALTHFGKLANERC